MRAYFLVLCITFFEVSLGLWILGIDYYLLIGLMIALLDILPVLGSGTVLIPWGVYLLLAGRYPLSAGIFLLYAVVTVMRSMIEPRIVGKKLGLHPLATVIAMYLGLKCCGVPGLMFAPFLLTLLVHLKRCGCLRIFR